MNLKYSNEVTKQVGKAKYSSCRCNSTAKGGEKKRRNKKKGQMRATFSPKAPCKQADQTGEGGRRSERGCRCHSLAFSSSPSSER